MDKLFSSIYKNLANPVSFTSANALYSEAKEKNPKVKLTDVKKWLAKQDSYTLHKPTRRKFKRNRIIVSAIDAQWEIDLAEMSSIHEYNNGYKYILTCIDVLSKYLWAKPLKSKTSQSVCRAFKAILEESKRTPYRVRSDKGKEFVNKDFKKLLSDYGIIHFTSQNEETKCAVVERVIRTLKNRIYHYFSENNTYRWIDHIDQIVYNYNHTLHRSIKEKPANVTDLNERIIWHRLYPEKGKIKAPQYKVGDYVRISKYKQVFDKSYLPQWSEEIFQITSVSKRRTEPLYTIADLNKDPIIGTFYEKELQKINYDPKENRPFKIESVIRKRRLKNGRIQLYVKWWGYPEKFNQWIFEDDLVTKP